ncbi:MAG: hypothetical protein Q9224_006767 [Gallowayella concinna]
MSSVPTSLPSKIRHHRNRRKRIYESDQASEQDESYRSNEPTDAQKRRGSIWKDIRPTAGLASQRRSDSCYPSNEQHTFRHRSYPEETERRKSTTVQGSSKTYRPRSRLDPRQSEHINGPQATLTKARGGEDSRRRGDGIANARANSRKRTDQMGSVKSDRRERTRRSEAEAAVCSDVAGWAANVSPAVVGNRSASGLGRERKTHTTKASKSPIDEWPAAKDGVAIRTDNTRTSPCIATEAKMPHVKPLQTGGKHKEKLN